MSIKNLRQGILSELAFLRSVGNKLCLIPFLGRSRIAMIGYSFINVLILCTTLQLIVTILSSKADWLTIINVVPNFGVCVMSLVKYIKIQTNRRLYDGIFTHFQDHMWDIVSPNSDAHKRIVGNYRRTTKYMNRFLFYYSALLSIMVNSFPYIMMKYEERFLGIKEYLYPFDAWYPFDKIKFYGGAYVWESCMTTLVVFVYAFTNMLNATLIILTCMELKILGNCIEEILSSDDVEKIKLGIDVVNIQNRATIKLKALIARHEDLAKRVAALDTVLGIAMLLNYSLGAVFICLTAFTSSVVTNLYLRMRYAAMCVSLLVEVFSQCFMGQIISDHSENLTESIYSSDWLYASPEMKKIMLMLMMRTQKPLELTGNGFIIMNMDTFSRICSTSYQFFNLLRTVYV